VKRIAAALLVALLAVGVTPPVRSRVKGALLAIEALDFPLRPLSWTTLPPHEREVELPSTSADLYRARGFSRQAGIVLVHGANPGGKDDPRVVGLARSLSRTGRRVLVPQLGLRNERLDRRDTTRILDAIEHLAVDAPVGVLAFSYGGGLTLVALGDRPEAQDGVAFVATAGTYYDIRHIVQGVTTGTVPFRRRTIRWDADPEGRDVLMRQLAFLLGRRDETRLRRAWQRRDPSDLEPQVRRVYDLVANRRPERVEELIARLPAKIRRLAGELSPSRVVDRIRVPVLALHSRDDPASPPTESRLLVAALEDRVDARLIEVGILRHLTPTRSPLRAAREGARIADFTSRVLRAQEGWPRV
jgi:pimeloyl-ACP methyl ester carboxylesterase